MIRSSAPLTVGHGCGSMLDAAATRECANQTAADKPPAGSKELAMRIGEEQEEFEILPAEDEQQPVVLPERDPQRQPEHVPA